MVAKAIGVDFGSSGIKLAEVTRTKDVTSVRKQAYMPVPRGFIRDGAIHKERAGELGEMLKEFLAAEKFSTRTAILGLNATSGVFANRAITNFHEPGDFREAIKHEIAANKPLLPGAPDAVTIDAVVFNDFMDEEDNRKLDVFMVGVSDEGRDLQLEVAKKAGLKVAGADLNALASLRAVGFKERPARNLDMLVDIGHDVLSVLIHDSGKPVALSLSEGYAGQEVSEMISHAIEDDDMARIDREKVDSPTDPRIIAAIDNYCFKVLGIIESAAVNYAKRPGRTGATVAQVTLVGAGSTLFRLRQKLEETLLIPVVIGKFDPAIQGDPERWHEGKVVRSDFVAAVGLAMGKMV